MTVTSTFVITGFRNLTFRLATFFLGLFIFGRIWLASGLICQLICKAFLSFLLALAVL